MRNISEKHLETTHLLCFDIRL